MKKITLTMVLSIFTIVCFGQTNGDTGYIKTSDGNYVTLADASPSSITGTADTNSILTYNVIDDTDPNNVIVSFQSVAFTPNYLRYYTGGGNFDAPLGLGTLGNARYIITKGTNNEFQLAPFKTGINGMPQGTYVVAYTASVPKISSGIVSGAAGTDETFTWEVVTSLSTNDNIISNDIKMYPSVAQDIVKLNFGSKIEGKLSLKIYSLLGKQVKSLDYDFPKGTKEINITALNSGMYILALEHAGKKQSFKLLVK
ncbi:T9SS type A sorting domain-containing protein [Algibacter amylolyticus]|uniref:T9SS type A sorting domain-containing protein n=1 Tax=Algibacter amylolyticus TaxID=1608400 RepID=A0A5M7BA60_9FLAO|nr:T9SS type A sorting domain-containing protein [Algibacter amylolyticus]KAA5825127.1 T9SS type A sorting domain-containing protein [Algibacter amylolyticus]MBB5268765.1 hypothetical protein [Algibacter amylolyticus]TSJ77621.1 T9SS type A sorting domain-containing protein [Algibacter amylolyticus]